MSDSSFGLSDAWIIGMWPHYGAGTSTQCHSAASGWVGGSWHRLSATTAVVPSVGHTGFLLSFFFLSLRASSSHCSMKSLLPVPFVPAHLPLCSSLPPISRVPQRFSQLQDSVLLTFHLLTLTTVLKHHSLPSFDGICFFGKHFTFSVTESNIPLSCISC